MGGGGLDEEPEVPYGLRPLVHKDITSLVFLKPWLLI